MNKNWKPSSWREKKAKHLPNYSDEKELNQITKKLTAYPPLVFAGESRNLLKEVIVLKVLQILILIISETLLKLCYKWL